MGRAMKPSDKRPSGVRGLEGSEGARKQAALVLEAWSGACGPVEAAERMGVALVRYYQLESRALQAVISALEPRARGRSVTPAGALMREEEKSRRLERELHRYQALYRSAARSLGIAPAMQKGESKPTKGKRRRRMTRGERVARSLASKPQATASSEAAAGGA
jgi:hypothetical protein